MQNMQVEFSFKGKARLQQIWNILTKGKVYTFLTEPNILSIYKQYSDQRIKEQLDSKQPLEPTV
jgi:hypothetical protein